MKTVLKVIGLLLLAILAFVLIAGIFVSKEYHFERSVAIDAPRDVVWRHISSLEEINSWSPWMKLDPQMEQSISGTDGTIGATHSWKGNKEAGSGSQTLTEIVPMERVRTDLHFIEPMEGKAQSYWLLTDESGGTRITWGFDTEYAYPFNTIQLFMDMDKIMDSSFSTGLASLKTMAEHEAAEREQVEEPVGEAK